MDDDSRIGARIMGRPQERLHILSVTERAELGRLAGSQSAPHGLVRRAQIILASAGGEANISIADRFGVSNPGFHPSGRSEETEPSVRPRRTVPDVASRHRA